MFRPDPVGSSEYVWPDSGSRFVSFSARLAVPIQEPGEPWNLENCNLPYVNFGITVCSTTLGFESFQDSSFKISRKFETLKFENLKPERPKSNYGTLQFASPREFLEKRRVFPNSAFQDCELRIQVFVKPWGFKSWKPFRAIMRALRIESLQPKN